MDLPQFVRQLALALHESPSVCDVEVRLVESLPDRVSGDLVVRPSAGEPIVVSWTSVDHRLRVLFESYVFEGVDANDALEVLIALAEGMYRTERRRHISVLRSRRVSVQLTNGSSYNSDWMGG